MNFWIGGAIPWILAGGILVLYGTWVLYKTTRFRMLLIPILIVLNERGILDTTGIIKAMGEKEIYPAYTPKSFVESVCKYGIRNGLIKYGGLAITPRFRISSDGVALLDKYDLRRGKKKISL